MGGSVARNLTGKTFGRLTVRERTVSASDRSAQWICDCRCGGVTIVVSTSLLRPQGTKSCNKCRDREKYTSEYDTWVAMNQRCYNPNDEYYHRYGGRGITVCESWRADFLNFLDDMGRRPTNLSIDRIKNDEEYSKNNCKWSDDLQQTLNRTLK